MKFRFKDGTIVEVMDAEGKNAKEIKEEAKIVYKEFKDSQKEIKKIMSFNSFNDKKTSVKDGIEFFGVSAGTIVTICKAVIYECNNDKYGFDILEGEELEGWKRFAEQGVNLPGHFILVETGKWVYPEYDKHKDKVIAFVVNVPTPTPDGKYDTLEDAINELRNRLNVEKVEEPENKENENNLEEQ